MKSAHLQSQVESIIEGSHDGIILTDHEKIVKVNSSFLRISGLKKERVEGRDITDLADSSHVCLKSINEVFYLVHQKKKSVTIMRRMHRGNEIYITGTPALCDGKIDHVTVNIRDVTELQRLQEQVSRLTALYLSTPDDTLAAGLAGENIIVESPVMKGAVDLAVRIAAVDSVVLIHGESGTGKEVLARLIHRLSTRSKGPFIAINCGAIPEHLLESELFGYEKGSFTGAWREGKPGLFELANGGIIFLDEVGEMPLNLQVKLLKVLQDMEVYRVGGIKPVKFDVRVIAATNRNLRDVVKEGKFREDLFYRLYVVPIEVPPLRERREDIFPLTWHFLKQYNQKYKQSKSFSSELIAILETYGWPGNVRELQNIVERLVVTGDADVLGPEHLPHSIYQRSGAERFTLEDNKRSGTISLSRAKEQMERAMLAQAMKTKQTTREIARLLEVDHSTVVRKLRKYGLNGAERHQTRRSRKE
jgi:PAS domain S-box-containing protein